MVNLRSLDLNLLVTLDALLQEQHVTRAAKRLGLTQPAVSNALERLRYLFKDPLLERAGPAMKPTPRAEALRAPLRQQAHVHHLLTQHHAKAVMDDFQHQIRRRNTPRTSEDRKSVV